MIRTILLVSLLATPAARAGSVLDHVRSTGRLACGVLSEPDDYGKHDTHGALPALGRDICRAVAAAVLGDPAKLSLAAYPDERHGFAALQAGAADLLTGASPSVSAGRLYGAAFGRPAFLDGQSFLVAKSSHIAAAADLAGRSVCFISGTGADFTLSAVLGARRIAYRPFPFEEMGEMEAALVTGHCDAMTGDLSQLADARAQFHAKASAFAILPDAITIDPVSPAWSARDPAWGRIADATLSALLEAEEEGLGQADAATLDQRKDAAAQDFLAAGRLGAQMLGLDPGWSRRALAAVGNYGEMFRRDLGAGSPLRLARGRNALWDRGGLLYPVTMR